MHYLWQSTSDFTSENVKATVGGQSAEALHVKMANDSPYHTTSSRSPGNYLYITTVRAGLKEAFRKKVGGGRMWEYGIPISKYLTSLFI